MLTLPTRDSLAVKEKVSCEAETNVVDRGAPFRVTTVLGVKELPTTVPCTSAPACAWDGLTAVITGCGLLFIAVATCTPLMPTVAESLAAVVLELVVPVPFIGSVDTVVVVPTPAGAFEFVIPVLKELDSVGVPAEVPEAALPLEVVVGVLVGPDAVVVPAGTVAVPEAAVPLEVVFPVLVGPDVAVLPAEAVELPEAAAPPEVTVPVPMGPDAGGVPTEAVVLAPAAPLDVVMPVLVGSVAIGVPVGAMFVVPAPAVPPELAVPVFAIPVASVGSEDAFPEVTEPVEATEVEPVGGIVLVLEPVPLVGTEAVGGVVPFEEAAPDEVLTGVGVDPDPQPLRIALVNTSSATDAAVALFIVLIAPWQSYRHPNVFVQRCFRGRALPCAFSCTKELQVWP